MPNVLGELLAGARKVMGCLRDRRSASNATKYPMEVIGMAALSVFVMQDPSFLSNQQRLAKGTSVHNFHTLFGCEEIPSPNHTQTS